MRAASRFGSGSAKVCIAVIGLTLCTLAAGCAPRGTQPAAVRQAAPLSEPARPSAADVLLELRQGDISAGKVTVDVTYRNLAETTMSVSSSAARCVMTATPVGKGVATSATVELKWTPSDGQPMGSAAAADSVPVASPGVGDSLRGTAIVELGPGEYVVSAKMLSNPGIKAVPIVVRVGDSSKP